jgi:crotonobetainyl-CoA:carnitine CoA-transferase CaiB-like acyl-CoA transferase
MNDPQVVADQLIVTPEIPHPTIGDVPMPGFPVVLTRTPPSARLSPPMLGQHTEEIKRMYTAKTKIKERT